MGGGGQDEREGGGTGGRQANLRQDDEVQLAQQALLSLHVNLRVKLLDLEEKRGE